MDKKEIKLRLRITDDKIQYYEAKLKLKNPPERKAAYKKALALYKDRKKEHESHLAPKKPKQKTLF